MVSPVMGIVRFHVSVTAYKAAADRWMVQTVETGVVTYGSTLEEAERLNGVANEKLVRGWKTHGRVALDRFMKKNSIVDYQVDEERGVQVDGQEYAPLNRALALAA